MNNELKFRIYSNICNNYKISLFLKLKLLKQHRSLRSALTTRIKDALFATFGESQLESINNNASPADVLAWKASDKTKACYKKLFLPINSENPEVTHISRILLKVWPGSTPTNIKAAYTITVCQIMLSEHYEKLTMKEKVVKNKLKKNLVSFFININLFNKFEKVILILNI